MNPKLESIAATAAANLQASIAEAEIEIMNAWQDVVGKAQRDGKQPALSLSLAIKINLEGDAVATTLSFGTRKKYPISTRIPDPNQPELGMAQGGELEELP